MEMEIRLSGVSIQAIAKLETLFGEGMEVTHFDHNNKLANVVISRTRMRENELFESTERTICDLFSFIQEKNELNKEYMKEVIHKSVDELCLSVRASNGLKNAGINLIGELASKSEKELLKIQNFANKCINEVKEALKDFNLHFDMRFEKFPDPEMIKKMQG
jgi:DNA-directed RNA polymerase alpha subunit